jgi:hypothetical protein
MAAKKPTMAQAYKAAQKSTAAKPKDKGIVGEGKDVLKAAGNSVKQQAEFVGAVGKGAVKGAGAIVKGAGKVAGKVANITVGDIASAPLDIAKNAGKVAAKVGKVLATPAGGSRLGAMAGKRALDPMTYMGKVAGSKAKDAKANKARQATDSKYDKVKAKVSYKPLTPSKMPKKPKNSGGMTGGGKPYQKGN